MGNGDEIRVISIAEENAKGGVLLGLLNERVPAEEEVIPPGSQVSECPLHQEHPLVAVLSTGVQERIYHGRVTLLHYQQGPLFFPLLLFE